MGRVEYALIAACVALVAFVGAEAVRAPSRSLEARLAPADSLASLASITSPTGGLLRHRALASTPTPVREPAPLHDVPEIRRRISAAGPDTYLPDMLASQDSMLVRWPDRRLTGIRVWVQNGDRMPGWKPADQQVVRDVFDEWLTAGLPLRFLFVLDSAGSDVQVSWLDHFPANRGREIGLTRRVADQYGWLVRAEIFVALHDSTGRGFSDAELTGVIRHEIGHALGLGHSPDRRTIMYPEETVSDIAAADRATLRLLYSLAPGPLK